MKHGDTIIQIYNGLVNKYQIDLCMFSENSTPENIAFYRSEKMREHLTHQLDVLSGFAYDLGEPELAASILRTAADLGQDGVQPVPM